MAWEKRPQGAASGYYYRSVREGDRVKKLYLGRGEEAMKAAELMAMIHHTRQEEQKLLREVHFPTEEAGQLALAVSEWALLLLNLWLISTGHHKHKGQWRKKRNG